MMAIQKKRDEKVTGLLADGVITHTLVDTNLTMTMPELMTTFEETLWRASQLIRIVGVVAIESGEVEDGALFTVAHEALMYAIKSYNSSMGIPAEVFNATMERYAENLTAIIEAVGERHPDPESAEQHVRDHNRTVSLLRGDLPQTA